MTDVYNNDRRLRYGAAELAYIGQLLYGVYHYQAGLARDLEVDPRRIRQWIAEERPIPATIWDDLQVMLTERKMLIDKAVSAMAAPKKLPRK